VLPLVALVLPAPVLPSPVPDLPEERSRDREKDPDRLLPWE
jgi:hypothetical protein